MDLCTTDNADGTDIVERSSAPKAQNSFPALGIARIHEIERPALKARFISGPFETRSFT
jgi:hypothetical protein